jgi:hypothetical protein
MLEINQRKREEAPTPVPLHQTRCWDFVVKFFCGFLALAGSEKETKKNKKQYLFLEGHQGRHLKRKIEEVRKRAF